MKIAWDISSSLVFNEWHCSHKVRRWGCLQVWGHEDKEENTDKNLKKQYELFIKKWKDQEEEIKAEEAEMAKNPETNKPAGIPLGKYYIFFVANGPCRLRLNLGICEFSLYNSGFFKGILA